MIRRLLGDLFWIPSLTMMVLAMVVPGDLSSLTPIVPIALGGILFFSGLRIPLSEFTGALRDAPLAGRCAAMAAVKLALMPLLAGVLCWLVAREWLLGVVLIAAMPAGFTSIALTDLYQGRRMSAVMLVAMSSLLVPISVPVCLALVRPDGSVAIAELLGQAGYLLLLLASPFVLAQIVRRIVPAFVARHDQRWGPCAVTCSIALVFIGIAANRHAWEAWPLTTLAPALIWSSIPVASGLIVILLARRVLPIGEAIAFAMGAMYINNGLGLAFATRYFPGHAEVLLPSALVQPAMLVAVAWLGWTLRRP